MKSAEGRLDKCEKALHMGASEGMCECVASADIRVWYSGDCEPEPSREPVVCPKCGKPRQVVVIQVVYDGEVGEDAG